MEKEPSVKKGKPPVKFIVPPFLKSHFFRFLDHFKVSKDEPVMIVGDTGVGKSMFLHIFKKLFREKHGAEVPIIEANCAHFSKELSVSELFGHARGAFTGAIKDKKGLVSIAKDGLLILEEIGELPDWVQAQLLTFIDTGRYRGVGEEAEKIAKVRIVGATNNEKVLRNDFRHRFFPFYIPPLYERRFDVLYYLANSFPDFIPTLTMTEVLALLAHNWPGNVREIDRVARLMFLNKMESDRICSELIKAEEEFREIQKQAPGNMDLLQFPDLITYPIEGLDEIYPKDRPKLKDVYETYSDQEKDYVDKFRKCWTEVNRKRSMKSGIESRRLYKNDQRYTFLQTEAAARIVKRVVTWEGDSALLETVLNKQKVGLNTENSKRAFSDKTMTDFTLLFAKYQDIRGRFEIQVLDLTKEFDTAFVGLFSFCNLFGQNPIKNSNILFDAARGVYDLIPRAPFLKLSANKREKVKKLLKAIMRSLLEIRLSDKSYPDDAVEYWQKLYKQKEQQILEQENKMFGSKNFDNIWTMKEDEVRKTYYEGLLNRSGGNVSRVAKMLGIPVSSLIGRLDKLGVQHGRKHHNELNYKQ